MFEETIQLIQPEPPAESDAQRMLTAVGFADWKRALTRLRDISQGEAARRTLSESLPTLLMTLSETATPDGSLINFERYVQSVADRVELFRYLSNNPRAVEILVKLFVGSQFLTEILLRNPDYLEKLTRHKRLAEFKSRQQFLLEAQEAVAPHRETAAKLDALRRFQRWELLRIGACDSFRLFDLKSVTVQLALLADSLVQCCLNLLVADLGLSADGFVVLAFGKLGGEELNYSSDIDLVFLAKADATQFWTLGQRLIKALTESTGEGFLYRVDMRLRPWGRSGSLVNAVDAHINYLKQHGMHWEKQALLKARVIAGDIDVGQDFLKRAEPLMYSTPIAVIRESIRDMKERIETELERQGRKWGEVKSGEGSIRDVEFIVQGLQLAHGGEYPGVRSFNTLDALVRLADFGFLQADEFRQLSTGYVFLRTIEHSLQLMHHKQIHALPDDPRELAYLARRLDFPEAAPFLHHYRKHCEAIRAIYERHIFGDGRVDVDPMQAGPDRPADHRRLMEPSYAETFDDVQIAQHAALLEKISVTNIVDVDAEPLDDGHWRVTVVGFDHQGDLSRICGLLFVHGFNIVDGQVYTAEQVVLRDAAPDKRRDRKKATQARKFVNVFTVQPSSGTVTSDKWIRYKNDLAELQQLVREGKQRDAQGRLARRVAAALGRVPVSATALFPVDIDIDNDAVENATVLQIQAEDTMGFLYELTNALALANINITHVLVSSIGTTVYDTLYVTNQAGEKITDPLRQQELRAAIVLIKHFTHLLPQSPNPETALLHFRDFLAQLFEQSGWVEDLSTLEDSKVLEALARLLGVSEFLWEDFLRLQHGNLFPVVKDVDALRERKPREVLIAELDSELAECKDLASRKRVLNAFKDREMFRTDMRHIMGHIAEFGQFSAELTDVAEVVVTSAHQICDAELRGRYGSPRLTDGQECPIAICALGKCGGRELGFASDIELMFIYEDNGRTDGREVISTTEYFLKVVELFTQTIEARREGIFQIDLRLRPYGRAGSLAVSYEAFHKYFAQDGAAWPYERQALVKLRPIGGDPNFGRRVVALRDELIYVGEPFDVAAMRAMREKQVVQLVKAGTLNAKLSSGGLVDIEYLVQGLQIAHGHRDPALRETNTRCALTALRDFGIITKQQHETLMEAYIFQRRLIDALRMVRGHAKDLTVPEPDGEEFEYLARRLGYENNTHELQDDLERYGQAVEELSASLLVQERDNSTRRRAKK